MTYIVPILIKSFDKHSLNDFMTWLYGILFGVLLASSKEKKKKKALIRNDLSNKEIGYLTKLRVQMWTRLEKGAYQQLKDIIKKPGSFSFFHHYWFHPKVRPPYDCDLAARDLLT